MLAAFLCRPFELILNRGLGRSTSAQAIARGLEGRSLALIADGTPLDVRIEVTGGRLRVTLPDGAAPDARICGGALSLSRLLRLDPRAPIRDGSVRISGDAEIAEQFRDLLQFATPDLEEELAQLAGDPLAHEVGNGVRAFRRWSRAAGRSVARSMTEYLQEESRMLPTQSEIREFAHAVDDIVNDVARAEARVSRLVDEP